MKSSIPSVSVLIPCFNRANIIRDVIESAKKQTVPPTEIIVADDASTDNSVAVIKDCSVTLVQHEKNCGPAIARNSAFSASSGEIIVFIDSDAIAESHMIENILNVYKKAPDSTRLGGVGGRGIETYKADIPNIWRCLHARQDFGQKFLDSVEYLFGLCCSYSREAFSAVKGFDPFFPINAGEDLDIGLRLIRAGYRLSYTPDAYIFHQHRDTLESLKRVQYNWVYWNYIVRKRNKYPVSKIKPGILHHLLIDTFTDLIVERNLQLAMLNLEIFRLKAEAIKKAQAATDRSEFIS